MVLTSVPGRGKLWLVTMQVKKPSVIPVPGQRGYLLHLAVPPSMWYQSIVVIVVAAASLSKELKQRFIFKT